MKILFFKIVGPHLTILIVFIDASGAYSAISGNGYPNLENCTVLNYNSIAYSPFGNGSANILNSIFIPLEGHEDALIAYSNRTDARIDVFIDYSFFLNPGTDVSLEGGGQISYGSNNVNGIDNPLFCNISTSNYTLAGNSPCLAQVKMGRT